MDRSCLSVTLYINDEKTLAAINNIFFKRLEHINQHFYKEKLAKSETEHQEPTNVGFFVMQYANLRMLELFNSFSTKFGDFDKYEEMQLDTDPLYIALAEKKCYDCIREEYSWDWEWLRSSDSNDSFTADARSNFFHRTCCAKHKKHDKRAWIVQGRISMH